MIVLPKRDNAIYQEIEAFEDYELTQCIAYEMAIRNSEIKEALDRSVIVKNKKEYILDNNLHGVENYLDNIIVHKDKREIKEEYLYLLQEHGFDYLELIEYTFLDKKDSIYSNLHSYKLEDILNKNELDIVCSIERTYWNSIKYTNVENDIIETNEEFLNQYLTSLDWVFLDPCERIIKNALQRSQRTNIVNKFKRPTLKPKGIELLNIDINLSLPKDELIAYISKLKNDYDKDNSVIQSPLELLGEKLEKSDMNISKKKLADKFFVYDYVKMRLKQIDEYNQEIKDDFSEEVQKIKDNYNFNDEYKKYLIDQAKEELKNRFYSTNINEIFDDEELKSMASQGTVKRYYYEIKPFIEDFKYKELITGTANTNTT